jgi:phage recombination protein Bet
MANNAVATIDPSAIITPAGFGESVELIRQTYAKDLNAEELSLFMADAHHRGLSIVKRQIYAAKYNGKMTIMVGIDGYRSQAESHPEYAGQEGPFYCGPDGQWTETWLGEGPPAAAKVGIYRKGFVHPITEVALWSEYNNASNAMWKRFPTVMLAKCAEARAIRKAFPAQLGGTYIAEEMDQSRRDAVETTGTVRTSQSRNQPRPMTATATVEDPERDQVKRSLWHVANKTYGWDQETLDLVSVEETGKHLVDHDAQGLKDLMVTLSTKTPDALQQLVDRATAIESPTLAGM